jgi:hypothetical protein
MESRKKLLFNLERFKSILNKEAGSSSMKANLQRSWRKKAQRVCQGA